MLTFTTTRENVVKVIELMGKLTSASTFPEKEVTQLVRQMVTMLEGKSDDPVTLGRDALLKHFATYPAGDPRNAMTTAETVEGLKTVTRDALYDWYKRAVATTNGEVAVVGDFDAQEVKAALKKALAAKKPADAKTAWSR